MRAKSPWNPEGGNVPETWVRMGSVLLVEAAGIPSLQEMRFSFLFLKVSNGAGNLSGTLGEKER